MLRVLSIAALVVFSPLSATAAVLEYTFSADFDSSHVFNGFDETADIDANNVQALGQITGTIQFDDTLISDLGDVKLLGPPSISIDGFVRQGFELPLTATLLSDTATYDAIKTGNAAFSPTTPNGVYTNISFSLIDNSNLLFASGLAFPDSLSLSDFDDTYFSVQSTVFDQNLGASGSASKVASFTITRLDPVIAVPLPAGLPLLAAGLGVMGWVGRRKRASAAK